MKNNKEKPSPEAKALSLFLMAFKTVKPIYKEQSKRINRLWGLVIAEEMSMADYMEKVESMLTLNGGYSKVVEKTVRHYLEKTGEWKLQGDDKYCQDAQEIAAKLLSK
ncbi:MAG: hypothetical protein ACI85Q_002464 [Salibacteraceae bacterium]|jgi:hypothetical protein